jgi:hypothetical protein
MFNRLSQCLALLAVLALSAPVFAKSMSQPMVLTQPATIGNTTLQPGHYKLTANLESDQVLIKSEDNGKLVATVTGRTVTLNRKSAYSAVVFNGRSIHEIQFSGKTEAIEIPNS